MHQSERIHLPVAEIGAAQILAAAPQFGADSVAALVRRATKRTYDNPGSATRSARDVDCNSDARAGFAAWPGVAARLEAGANHSAIHS